LPKVSPAICHSMPPSQHRCNGGPWCWCRRCRRKKVPGAYRRSSPGEAEPWVRTCCLDSWLSRGWFCRWCGRDQDSGREGAVQGIYGNRQGAEVHRPYKCNICGTSLPSTINSGSCRACYWVLTRQLVRRLVARFGRWSEIHDSIFCFLTEPHFILENDPRFHAWFRARFRVDVLAEVRQHGLLQGSAEPLPGVRLRRREVGMEGQRRFAKRYRLGDVDWIPPRTSTSTSWSGTRLWCHRRGRLSGELPRSSPARPDIRWPTRSRAGAGGPSLCWNRPSHSRTKHTSTFTLHLATGAGISRSRLATASRLRAPLGVGCASFESASCANVCMSGAGSAAAGQGSRRGRVRTRSSAASRGVRLFQTASPVRICARGASPTSCCLCSVTLRCLSRRRAATRFHACKDRGCVAPCVRICQQPAPAKTSGAWGHGCDRECMDSGDGGRSGWKANGFSQSGTA